MPGTVGYNAGQNRLRNILEQSVPNPEFELLNPV
jgi:hypothetical protein